MIRSLAQAAAQKQLDHQMTERRGQQQRDTQRQARQQLLNAREAQKAPARDPRLPATSRQGETATLPRPALRAESKRPSREEDALFSALLEGEDAMLPVLTLQQGGDQQQGFSAQATPENSSTPPAMALWQEIETALNQALENEPPAEMTLTLMLPKLGNVDAQMSALAGGGWAIALRLQPAAWQALLPHQERCRFSLRQRLACRVSLRFERRDPREEEA